MKQVTINHRRITRLVKSIIDYEVFKAEKYYEAVREDPDGDATKAMAGTFIQGIDIVNGGRTRKKYVTVNDEFLELVGYDDNLGGFLADYFGSDYTPECDGDPKFRYIDGILINPTILNGTRKKES